MYEVNTPWTNCQSHNGDVRLKIAVTTTTYNRPDKLNDLCKSLSLTVLPNDVQLKWFISDDCSIGWIKMLGMIQEIPFLKVIRRNAKNLGADLNTISCFELALTWAPVLIINLDADALVKPDWIRRYQEVWTQPEYGIISGFNSPYHLTTSQTEKMAHKKSAPGLGLSCKPELLKEAKLRNKYRPNWGGPTSWDYQLGYVAKSRNLMIGCIIPSVVQHQAGGGIHNTSDDYARDW